MNVRSVVLRARKVRLFIREKFNIPIVYETKGQTKNIKIVLANLLKSIFVERIFPL